MSIEKRPAGRGMRRSVGRWRSGRDVEHAEHAPQAGDGGLGLVEHLGELGDRLEVPVGEEHEAHQRPGGHSAGGPIHTPTATIVAIVTTEKTSPEREQEGADDAAADLGVGAALDSCLVRSANIGPAP